MPTPVARLLIVDDEAALTRALCDTLEPEGYSTTGFTSAREALAVLREHPFDVVLTDLMMPEMDGISVLGAAFEIDPNLVGIVMTGHGSVNTAVKALKAGALDYILKPFKLNTILPVLTRALTVRRLRMENIQLREALGLHQLSMTIALARDSEAVLQRVADTAFEQSGAAGLAILLVDEDHSPYVAAVRGDRFERQLTGQRVPNTPEVRRWMARCGEFPLDVQTVSEAPPVPGLPPGLSIPLLAGGKLTGILHFAIPPNPGRQFTSGQMKALGILASAGASALAAASLMERLGAAEERYRHLAEHAPDIVSRYEFHPKPGFVYVNPAITPVTGYPPADFYADPHLGLKTTHPEDRALAEMVLRGETPSGLAVTLRWVHRSGRIVWIEQRNALVHDREGRLVAIETVSRDITERRDLEEKLQRSQKLEAIGQLTAGVAHDFNNLLTIINGYNALALQEVDPSTPTWFKLTEIRKAGVQATNLTAQLLAFSRTQMLKPRVVDLGAILRDMDPMIRQATGHAIEVVVGTPRELGPVKIDPSQIQQVILNLAVNARDAMSGGGTLQIELANANLDEARARALGVAPGSFVILTVADNGSGMTPEVKSRVFEPFFTTKEMGRGTGLGLATVYGVVQQSGGHIHLESEPGQGTRFTLLFQRCDEPAEPQQQETQAATGGSETILLVEDNPGVRALIGDVLSASGYTVLAAESGDAAIEIADRHTGRIDLLLTDLGLPGMPGDVVAERVQARLPGIKVLFMSGYTETPPASNGSGNAPEVLQKPLAPADLCAKVRQVLSASSQPLHRVLVVDDDEPIRFLLKEILEGAGYQVETAANGREARKRLSESPVDLVITDLIMPEMEGIEFIGSMRKERPGVKLIATSGGSCLDLLAAAHILGAHATLPKPLTPELVLKCIRGLS